MDTTIGMVDLLDVAADAGILLILLIIFTLAVYYWGD
jgi:hypothetical protein